LKFAQLEASPVGATYAPGKAGLDSLAHRLHYVLPLPLCGPMNNQSFTSLLSGNQLKGINEMAFKHAKPNRIPADQRGGKIKYGIFAWLLGLPLPIILLALFFGGCDF
jgi:hypothetical protein